MLAALKIFNTFFLKFFIQTLGKISDLLLYFSWNLDGNYCFWTFELLCEKLSNC